MDCEYSDPAFINLLQAEGNNICNDCLQLNPKWCSPNNAVFLCSQCARKHQSLSRNNSYVKSIEVDEWNKEEIQIIKNGGNIRFNLTMEEFRIPLMSNYDYKYQNNASLYYRNLLLKEVHNPQQIQSLFKPSIPLGVLLIDMKSNIVYPEEVVEIIQQHKHEYQSINMLQGKQKLHEEDNVFDNSMKTIGNAFDEFKSNVKLAWDGVNFQEKFEESSEKAKKWAQSSKEYIVDKKNKVVESQIFQNIKEKTNNSINSIKVKANELINSNNSQNSSNQSNYSNISEVNHKDFKDIENEWSNK